MHILKLLIPAAFLSLSLAIFSTSVNAQSGANVSNTVTAQLDSLFDILEQEEAAMGSISLWQNGHEIYTRSTGMASAKPQRKAHKNTKYRMGSISKVYTAVLTLKMIEQGKLKYHTPLSEFYPEIINAEKITIRHLLRHRSGLFNITNADDYRQWMEKPITEKQMLEKIKTYPSQFAPGTSFQYSNTNYILLTYILQKVSGLRYADLLKKQITTPFHLPHTYPTDTLLAERDEALSFKKYGQWERGSITHGSVPLGAGNLVSTASEINAFLHTLFRGKLLQEATLDSMQTMIEGYGMGLLTVPFHNKKAYGHTGGIDNYRAQAFYFPNENFTYTYLTNGLDYPLKELSIAVLSIYFQKDFSWPEFSEPVTLPPELLEQYTGLYSKEGFPLKITITEASGTLKAQATGQPAFPLTAKDKQTFTFKPAGVIIKFNSEKEELMLLQNGMEYRLTKE